MTDNDSTRGAAEEVEIAEDGVEESRLETQVRSVAIELRACAESMQHRAGKEHMPDAIIWYYAGMAEAYRLAAAFVQQIIEPTVRGRPAIGLFTAIHEAMTQMLQTIIDASIDASNC